MIVWSVLAVDDEALCLAELVHCLRQDPRVGDVVGARDGIEALRLLRMTRYDAVFLDVNMPGLDGMDIAGVLAGQAHRPVVVFVTAHDARAVEAYGLDAVDFVLKPLRAEHITGALDRVERRIASSSAPVPAPITDTREKFVTVAVEDGRRTFFVRRDDVLFAEAHRDYVHLHTRGPHAGVHTVRMPLSDLESAWGPHGFLRVHRGYLVALSHVSELARDPLGGHLVRVAGRDLPVSRRQVGVLRQRILALGRRGAVGTGTG